MTTSVLNAAQFLRRGMLRDATLVVPDKAVGAIQSVVLVTQRLQQLNQKLDRYIKEKDSDNALNAANAGAKYRTQQNYKKSTSSAGFSFGTNKNPEDANMGDEGEHSGDSGFTKHLMEIMGAGAIWKTLKGGAKMFGKYAFKAASFGGRLLGGLLSGPAGWAVDAGLLAWGAWDLLGEDNQKAIVSAVKGGISNTLDFIKNTGTKVGSYISKKWEDVQDIWSKGTAYIGETVKTSWREFTGATTKYSHEMEDWFVRQGSNMGKWFDDITIQLNKYVNSFELKRVASEWLQSLTDWIKSKFGFGGGSSKVISGGSSGGGVSGGGVPTIGGGSSLTSPFPTPSGGGGQSRGGGGSTPTVNSGKTGSPPSVTDPGNPFSTYKPAFPTTGSTTQPSRPISRTPQPNVQTTPFTQPNRPITTNPQPRANTVQPSRPITATPQPRPFLQPDRPITSTPQAGSFVQPNHPISHTLLNILAKEMKSGTSATPTSIAQTFSPPTRPHENTPNNANAAFGGLVTPGSKDWAAGNLPSPPPVAAIGKGSPEDYKGKNAVGGWWTPDKIKHAVDRLQKEAGLSPYGAAGLVARWAGIESANKGTKDINDSTGAYGIAQWLGDRKVGIAGNTDYDAQLDHVVQELNGSESKAAQMLRDAKTNQEGATGASAFERAAGSTTMYPRDLFTDKTPVQAILDIVNNGGDMTKLPPKVATNGVKSFGNVDLAFGDSTANRLGLPGDSKDSRQPKDSEAALDAYLKSNNVKGKNVVISSVSNDNSPAGYAHVTSMADKLKAAGANVNIMGVGPGGANGLHAQDPKYNTMLSDYADAHGMAFTPMGPTADSIHEASAKDQLNALSQASIKFDDGSGTVSSASTPSSTPSYDNIPMTMPKAVSDAPVKTTETTEQAGSPYGGLGGTEQFQKSQSEANEPSIHAHQNTMDSISTHSQDPHLLVKNVSDTL